MAVITVFFSTRQGICLQKALDKVMWIQKLRESKESGKRQEAIGIMGPSHLWAGPGIGKPALCTGAGEALICSMC